MDNVFYLEYKIVFYYVDAKYAFENLLMKAQIQYHFQ